MCFSCMLRKVKIVSVGGFARMAWRLPACRGFGRVFLLMLALCVCVPSRAQATDAASGEVAAGDCGCDEEMRWGLGLKTNLLYDAAALPTLGAELSFCGRWSLGVDATYMWLQNHRRDRHWRVEGGDIYLRRWWGQRDGQLLTGHHLGVYAQMYTYQLQLCDSHGFISGTPGEDIGGKPALGIGIEYGWSARLSKRLTLDLGVGIGYLHARVNRYGPVRDCCRGEPVHGRYTLQRSHCVNWFGPTKAEVALVWRFGK